MKLLVVSIVFLIANIGARAQDVRLIAESTGTTETVKNSPFSADAVSESVQTLADGNRIVRSTSSKLYRNSDGRFRRDLGAGSGSLLGSIYTLSSGVSILDPAAGQKYLLDTVRKTARVTALKAVEEKSRSSASSESKAILERMQTAAPIAAIRGEMARVAPLASGVVALAPFAESGYESRTEELGTRTIEGVAAEGTRKTTTIPAAAIGNERPIEIVYERWYSNELRLVVMSKHSDPRFGEQTYRLTNIVRTEPDAALFALPDGYRVVTAGEAPLVYKLSTQRKAEVEKAPAAKGKAASPTP